MELLVPKFTIIDGSKESIPVDKRIEALELEINSKIEATNKELITFAYNLTELGRPLIAQKQLSRISSGYFDTMIYKDLFEALLRASSGLVIRYSDKDFIFVVKRSLELFEELNFHEKPAFYRFRHEFERLKKGLNSTLV